MGTFLENYVFSELKFQKKRHTFATVLRKFVIEEWLGGLGSLEKTVIASIFHSGLHTGTIFFVEKTISYVILGKRQVMPFFEKKSKKISDHLQLFLF